LPGVPDALEFESVIMFESESANRALFTPGFNEIGVVRIRYEFHVANFDSWGRLGAAEWAGFEFSSHYLKSEITA
jgi:hypothetical protein